MSDPDWESLEGLWYQQMLDAVTDAAIYAVDPRGRIMTWNRGAELLSGYSAEEAIGRSIEMLYCSSDVIDGTPFDEMERAESCGEFVGIGLRQRADGSSFLAYTTMRLLRDSEAGAVLGFVRTTWSVDGARGGRRPS